MIRGFLKGHSIIFVNDQWIYEDTKELTITAWRDRLCGHCGMSETEEGHDACLGTLPGVMNACCGHGIKQEAYVQFLDGVSIHGESASIILAELKRWEK